MKKFIFYILLVFNSNIYSSEIVGEWKFTSITNIENDTLYEISDNDKLIINNNKEFKYSLYHKKVIAIGKWKLKKNLIEFNYNQPKDTVRNYNYSVSDNELILTENNTIYKFNRISKKKGFIESKSLNFFRGFIGVIFLVLICFVFSLDRNNINWKLVLKGILIQFILAYSVINIPLISSIFEFISSAFIKIISFTDAGTNFLFASYISGKIDPPLINFIIQVIPTIIFFSALTSIFYYLGILQKIVNFFSLILRRILTLSGAESFAAIGNIFLGQTEAPLLVKPYLSKMTKSEIFCLMSGGMATIAGGVLAAYIIFLGNNDSNEQILYAQHLITASILSAPAAIVCAKIIVPEKNKFSEFSYKIDHNFGNNVLEAINIGTYQGIKLAINVAGMLLVFTALIAMTNYIFKDIIGDILGLNNIISNNTSYSGLSLEFVFGYIFSPVAWIMGVPWDDAVLVGQLLGEKTILNEFIAFKSLGEMKSANLFTYDKSIIMSTYILCGFANFASIGIQIGGIGSLAPNQTKNLSELGLRALIAGTIASLFTAVIIGMIM